MTQDPPQCLLFEMTPDNPPKGWKRSMGLFGWAGDELFVPSTAIGISSTEALLCSSYDGVPIFIHGRTVLISEQWARSERPSWNHVIDAIRARALDKKPP
jgi:hypothetical protein